MKLVVLKSGSNNDWGLSQSGARKELIMMAKGGLIGPRKMSQKGLLPLLIALFLVLVRGQQCAAETLVHRALPVV